MGLICGALSFSAAASDHFSLEELMDERAFASSVSDAHTHKAGDFMFSYDKKIMSMSGVKSGSRDVEVGGMYGMYMNAPLAMEMDMDMFHVMYAPTDNLTLALMGMYETRTMKSKPMMGDAFVTSSSGWNDLSLGVNYKAMASVHGFSEHELVLSGKLSLPTGSQNHKDVMGSMVGSMDMMGMAPMESVLPYAMQLSSGTVDATVGATYLVYTDVITYGADAFYKIRTGGLNDNGYQLGDVFEASAFASYSVTDSVSIEGALKYLREDEMKGVDSRLNPMMSPAANGFNSGKNVTKLSVGVQYLLPFDATKTTVSIHFDKPLGEDFNGLQMSEDETIRIGFISAY